MNQCDNRILELLNETDIKLTPFVVAENIDYNRQYVNRRMRILATNELVENTGDGLYRITERGRQYLADELDKDDIEPGLHEE
jgi:predicted transcriptional regulator